MAFGGRTLMPLTGGIVPGMPDPPVEPGTAWKVPIERRANRTSPSHIGSPVALPISWSESGDFAPEMTENIGFPRSIAWVSHHRLEWRLSGEEQRVSAHSQVISSYTRGLTLKVCQRSERPHALSRMSGANL